MTHRQNPKTTAHGRDPRMRQTEAESLLWYVLRGRRWCGLQFRRHYPLEPFIWKKPCVARFWWVTRQTEQFGARRAERVWCQLAARCEGCARVGSGGQSGTKPALFRCSVGPTFAATRPNTLTEQENTRLRLPVREFCGPNLPMLPTKRCHAPFALLRLACNGFSVLCLA